MYSKENYLSSPSALSASGRIYDFCNYPDPRKKKEKEKNFFLFTRATQLLSRILPITLNFVEDSMESGFVPFTKRFDELP